jgi:rRNA maturation protein Rpf1
MRIVLTTSNSRLTRETLRLVKDMENLFPTAEPIPRNGRPFERFLSEVCPGEGLVVRLDQVDHNRRRVLFVRKWEKDGRPVLKTITFTLVSYMLCSALGGSVTKDHTPELILSNFTESPEDSSVIREISEVFGAKQPEFEGREVVSLIKKRGFIFCRRHRYIIRIPENAQGGEKVRSAEVGPRMTLKLVSITEDGNVLYRHTSNTKIKD